MAVDGRALGGGKAPAALPPGDRRGDLDGGDPGESSRVARLGGGLGANLTAADFGHMAFDKGAGVEEERRHLAALPDNGFRERLAFDADRLVVRIVVIGGGIRQPGDAAFGQELLMEFRDGERPLRFSVERPWRLGSLAGRLGRRLLRLPPGTRIIIKSRYPSAGEAAASARAIGP